MKNETIFALSTAPINSALAIIRVSGEHSLTLIKNMFDTHTQKEITPRMALYGSLKNNGELIDDVILIYYKAPSSFTGEDMIEIFCHGNRIIIKRIMETLRMYGAVDAGPGEFSKRAFLNGKIDLTEAEAINSVICAKSDWELNAALKQMHGSLKKIINEIRNDIITLKADIESGIDFIEEDIEFVSKNQAIDLSLTIFENLEKLHQRCKLSEALSKGIDVVIIGKPNVGKSSLLNAILNKDRAIVSNIPGTTRDIITESVQIAGYSVNIIDTAGIEKPKNEIEKIGIELSRKNIKSSSIVLAVFAASEKPSKEDELIVEEVKSTNVIYIMNKSDIACDEDIAEYEKMVRQAHQPDDFLLISAKTGDNLERLETMIGEKIKLGVEYSGDSFIADGRILDLLQNAKTFVQNSTRLLHENAGDEIIAFELQSAIDSLNEITGEISPDDVLGSVFARFCVGK